MLCRHVCVCACMLYMCSFDLRSCCWFHVIVCMLDACSASLACTCLYAFGFRCVSYLCTMFTISGSYSFDQGKPWPLEKSNKCQGRQQQKQHDAGIPTSLCRPVLHVFLWLFLNWSLDGDQPDVLKVALECHIGRPGARARLLLFSRPLESKGRGTRSSDLIFCFIWGPV